MWVSGLLKHTVDLHQPRIFLKFNLRSLFMNEHHTFSEANFFQARDMM